MFVHVQTVNIEFDGISLVYGPSAIAATGSCDSSEQTITIPLSNNFTLSVGFSIKDEYSFVTSLNVTFLLDSRTFKGYNNVSTLSKFLCINHSKAVPEL